MSRLSFALAALALGCSAPPVAERPVPRAVLEAHARDVHALAFSPDGASFASAGSGADPAVDEITLWTTATGARRRTFADYKGVATCLAFSPDGTLLAVGGVDGRIALLEIDSGAERIAFKARPGPVACLSFSFDGRVLASVVNMAGDRDGVEVCRWDVKMGAPRETFVVGAAYPFTLSPDASALAWAGEGEPAGIRTLNLETKEERLLSKVGVRRGDTMTYSPDGKWLAAVHFEEWSPIPNRCPYVYLIDAQSGRVKLRSPRPFDARRGLAVSHDARFLARGVDVGLQIWDLKELDVKATVNGSAASADGARMLAFSPDDRTLISTGGPGLLILWEVPELLKPADRP